MSQEDTTTTPEGQEPTEGQEPNAGAEENAGAGNGNGGQQETFSAAYVKKLREDSARYRTEAKDAQGKLKEREDAELSEAEKAKKEAKEATERAEKAEAQALRAEVATKKKLSPGMAARLVGDTKDELEKDADKLLKEVSPGTGGSFDGGAGRGSAPKQSDMNNWLRNRGQPS